MTEDSYSTFVNSNLRADVIKSKGIWGCVFYRNNERIKKELYTGHSESYAEKRSWKLCRRDKENMNYLFKALVVKLQGEIEVAKAKSLNLSA